MLTWRERKLLLFDAETLTLKQTQEFNTFTGEGKIKVGNCMPFRWAVRFSKSMGGGANEDLLRSIA